jgi:predicted NBD/HSP70 family sugar kinase
MCRPSTNSWRSRKVKGANSFTLLSSYPDFRWRDLPVSEVISSAVGLPVVIDNDANSVALAELWFGRPEVNYVDRYLNLY